ncbi:hypothetical protein [Pseudoduganella sp. RAF53_2]|uniref:hypothetical protein n=1 Tax=unclassified Pseudoduganella TaxID=2637179 RepID=UPI003F9D07B1
MTEIEQRIVIFAPVGKDGRLINQVLEHVRLNCHICAELGKCRARASRRRCGIVCH